MKSTYTHLFVITFSLLSLISCNVDDAIDELSVASEDDLPEITMGVPFNPSGVTNCSQVFNISSAESLCVLFNDGFERSEITGSSAFNWNLLIMDNGFDGSNVDARIEDQGHLGHVIEGDRAIMFNGRQGGSTHEIYLISNPLDLTNYDKLFIQFRYLPIDLESEITLSWSGEKLPEGIRIDVCNSDDYDCGLSGSNSHLRIRDNSVWDQYFPLSQEFGSQLNIRNFVEQDWKLGQVLIDLNTMKIEEVKSFLRCQ